MEESNIKTHSGKDPNGEITKRKKGKKKEIFRSQKTLKISIDKGKEILYDWEIWFHNLRDKWQIRT
jgi:hypothetical protein